MATQFQWRRSRPTVAKQHSKKTGHTYDSLLEMQLHEGALSTFNFHVNTIGYTIDHTYHPDFSCKRQSGGTLFIESKGCFLESSEARKYLYIRDVLEDKDELVFIFSNPKAALPWSKKRKDGTKRTHAEWAEKNNFKYFDKNLTQDDILEEVNV